MQLGVPDPRDNLRTQQELTKDRANTINLINMTIAQLLNAIKDAKSKKERDKALKALIARILNGFKSICAKGMSAGDAAKISALGNGPDSAGDTAKSGSAGDAAKSSAK